MPFVPYTQVSRTVARELEVFDESFRGALAVAEPDSLWAAQHGYVMSADVLKATFPIPLDAAGYKEFKGDMKFRSLYERVISVFNDKTWQDGIEELADTIKSDKFLGWGEQPGNMAREWTRLPNILVGAMLESNPNLELYRDPDTLTLTSRALFATDHPCNILMSGVGTFDNTLDTTQAKILNGQFQNDLKTRARAIKGPNGQLMGFRGEGSTVLCNGTRAELLDEAFKVDTVIREISNAGVIAPPGAPGTVVAAVTQRNRHLGTMSYQICDELTTASDDYLYVILAGGPVDNHPWVSMQESAPRVIIQDESSHKFAQNLKVSYSADGKCKAAPLFPHRIMRVHITA